MRSLGIRPWNRVFLASMATAIYPSHLNGQALDSDVAAIYRVALDELYGSREKPGVILLSDSIMRYTGDASWISSVIRIDYTAPPMKAPFPTDLSYPIPLKRLSALEKDSLHSAGQAMAAGMDAAGKPVPPAFWLALSRRYPSAWGLSSLSEVLFNETRDRAVLWAHHGCGGCFHSETMLLEKAGDHWRVADRLVRENEAVDGIGPGNMRYLWVDARLRVDSLIAAHLAEMREADSMRRDTRPRRYRGIVVNKATGRPTSNAAAYIHVPPDTIPRLLPFVRTGEFELIDHPIGGGLLVVQCAGFPANHNNPIAVTTIQIEPAQDTTVRIEALSMSPCWRSRRARGIVSGELESALFVTSPLPSREEAPIYQAVLGELRRDGKVLIRPGVAKPCAHSDWMCGVPELALLEREGEIDAVSIRGLSRRVKKPHPFNPAFARTAGVTLLTDGEAKYLMTERQAADPNRMHPTDSTSDLVKAAVQAYPGIRGITSLSEIAYDEAGDRAIIQVRTERPDSLNAVQTMIVARNGAGWTVTHPHVEKIKLTGAYSGNACVPSRAGSLPSESQIVELAGRYAFEIVSTTGASSGLRGLHLSFRPRPADSSGKRPAPFFQVFDAATGARDEATESGMFLSSGAQEFQRFTRAARLHGERYQLEILGMRDGAIFGSWRYFRGYFYDTRRERLPDPAGHFCARRLTEPRNPDRPSVASLY